MADDRRFSIIPQRVNFSLPSFLDTLARAENEEGVISKQQQLQAVCGVVTCVEMYAKAACSARWRATLNVFCAALGHQVPYRGDAFPIIRYIGR